MAVPVYVRSVVAAAGGLLVLLAWASVIGTLIVPRSAGGRLARWVDRIVTGAFRQATSAITDYQRRDRVLARQAAAMLLAQLGTWLGTAFIGYWLLMWPLVGGGLGTAFAAAGSSMFTLGAGLRSAVPGAVTRVCPGGPRPAVPAQRVRLLSPGGLGDGLSGT
jgi:hypothetical protein